jgi:hypothetical protein
MAAQATGINSTLHEHFHQLQFGQPDHGSTLSSLGLGRNDRSDWILNYPFPYEDEKFARSFKELANALLNCLQSPSMPKHEFSQRVAQYLTLRDNFKRSLASDDYKYLSFQVWQEGIARYTEQRIAERAAREYKPTREFRRLNDFTPFTQEGQNAVARNLKELADLSLSKWKRVAFYSFGAGEGLLLDRLHRKWHRAYFERKIYLENYFPVAGCCRR